MRVGKLNPVGSAKINFPGFQEILDFTSAGSESSVSVAVDGDTDKEYKIVISTAADTNGVILKLNNAATNYGYQRIANFEGTIAALRDTTQTNMIISSYKGISESTLLTPTGFPKTLMASFGGILSGTTVRYCNIYGHTYNSTSNVTSLDFSCSSGNFTSGTRICVYARREQ
jgi:hypothetical protein